MSKPKIGIYSLTGCAGDQLTILNCEDELLAIAQAVDIKSFIMAMTGNVETELDIALVEGSVTQAKDLERLEDIRARSGLLIAIGTCAVWGGVQAMENETSREDLIRKVYGVEGKTFESLPALPLYKFVKVDFSISGCPIEKEQLLRSISSLLHGDVPLLPSYAVCTECKMNEYECLLIKNNILCLGPITVAGCKARCPSLGLPCIGCRGPVEEANVASEIDLLKEKGYTITDIQKRLCTFAGPAEDIVQAQEKK